MHKTKQRLVISEIADHEPADKNDQWKVHMETTQKSY